MKKLLLVTGLTALACTTAFAEENISTSNSKWTGQIVPRIEIEDTNVYGADEAHPTWIKKLTGTLKHKDYSNWTFIYDLQESEKNTSHFLDDVDGDTLYRVYPGIQYSRQVTDKLTLGLALRDKWQLSKNANDETNWKLNSYRLVPEFRYQINDKLDLHGKAYFIKNIYYDRDAKKSKFQRNGDGYEVQTGFTYKFAPGYSFLADYWEEAWEKEHSDLYEGDKMRHQQIRPTLSLKVSEKDTLELYGRIQISEGQVTRDNKAGKSKVNKNRYGFNIIHKFNDQFTLNAGFAVEPNIKTTGYTGKVTKSDWYYYTARLVYKF